MYACRIPLIFPKSWVCVWVGGWEWVGGRVDVQARVVFVSEWVCVFAVPIYFDFFPLAFVLANDLSLVSRCFLFRKCVRFCFRFCCRLFLFVVCTCILCLLPCHTRCSFIDVLSCTPTGVSEINHLTWLATRIETWISYFPSRCGKESTWACERVSEH